MEYDRTVCFQGVSVMRRAWDSFSLASHVPGVDFVARPEAIR